VLPPAHADSADSAPSHRALSRVAVSARFPPPCPPAADACRSLEPACGEASRGLEPLEGGSRYCRGSQRTGPGRVLSRRHYIVIVAGGGGGCWPGLAFYAAAAGRSRSVRMGPSRVLSRSLRRARVMSEGLNRDGWPQSSGEAGAAWPLGSSARCAGPDSGGQPGGSWWRHWSEYMHARSRSTLRWLYPPRILEASRRIMVGRPDAVWRDRDAIPAPRPCSPPRA
jgi:hypothetical protein